MNGGAFVRCMCGQWQRGAKNAGHAWAELEKHWKEAHGIDLNPPKPESTQKTLFPETGERDAVA